MRRVNDVVEALAPRTRGRDLRAGVTRSCASLPFDWELSFARCRGRLHGNDGTLGLDEDALTNRIGGMTWPKRWTA